MIIICTTVPMLILQYLIYENTAVKTVKVKDMVFTLPLIEKFPRLMEKT